MIKTAAKIKQAEDQKNQKIKALKYLATIGCGCYNKNGEVTDALIAAMEDCTEEVRYEAVQAVMTASTSEMCANCQVRSCCSVKMNKKLYQIAFERDDECCFKEPSERVRDAALEALRLCSAGGRIKVDVPPAQLNRELEGPEMEGPSPVEPLPEIQPIPDAASGNPDYYDPAPSAAKTRQPRHSLTEQVSHLNLLPGANRSSSATAKPIGSAAATRPATSKAAPGANWKKTGSAVNAKKAALTEPASAPFALPATVSASIADDNGASVLSATPEPRTARTVSHSVKPSPSVKKPSFKTSGIQPVAYPQAVFGEVEVVNAAENLVGVQFEDGASLPAGSIVRVYRRYLTGKSKVADLEVIEVDQSRAACRPLEGTDLGKVERGCEVVANR